jgi:large subunit ribosomal protein L28
MSRRCQLTGKKANNSVTISFSHKRNKHLQQVNLQQKRIWWAGGKRFVSLKISTKAIKTLQKKGLEAFAKEAGINLNHF